MIQVYNIFQSINGEVCHSGMGSMCTFIRFAGCHASCRFCDTKYAKDPNSGINMTIEEVLTEVFNKGCNNITITGGEPFEQREALSLLTSGLHRNGNVVSVETNGLHAFDRNDFPINTHFVVDIKNTGCVCMSHYYKMNLRHTDYIKMVIGNVEDFYTATKRKYQLQEKGVMATFAFSPEYGKISPDTLLSWMKQCNQFDAVLNVQLHKILELTEAK